MLKPTMRKLYGKLLTLGILAACLWFVSRPVPAYATGTCESCFEAYADAMRQCDVDYDECMSGPSACSAAWQNCRDTASSALDACLTNCTWATPGGGGGGGGGGGRTRTPCEQACYTMRSECQANGGNPNDPDVEDCLANGGTVIWCCHLAYSACMESCQ
jgi:hypothetical protein